VDRLMLAISVCLVASTAFAGTNSDMAARTELHAIDTLTLPDAQFLNGEANAKTTVTTRASHSEWRRAATRGGPTARRL
jgi:hypothetical protein